MLQVVRPTDRQAAIAIAGTAFYAGCAAATAGGIVWTEWGAAHPEVFVVVLVAGHTTAFILLLLGGLAVRGHARGSRPGFGWDVLAPDDDDDDDGGGSGGRRAPVWGAAAAGAPTTGSRRAAAATESWGQLDDEEYCFNCLLSQCTGLIAVLVRAPPLAAHALRRKLLPPHRQCC